MRIASLSPMVETPQPLPTTDKAASIGNKVFQDLLNDCVPIAETAIIAAEPWMGTPVLKETWEEIFQLIVKELGDAGGTLTGYVIMDVQKFFALMNAASALNDLRAAQLKGDPDEISKANDAADAAVAPILHYVGDVRPQ